MSFSLSRWFQRISTTTPISTNTHHCRSRLCNIPFRRRLIHPNPSPCRQHIWATVNLLPLPKHQRPIRLRHHYRSHTVRFRLCRAFCNLPKHQKRLQAQASIHVTHHRRNVFGSLIRIPGRLNLLQAIRRLNPPIQLLIHKHLLIAIFFRIINKKNFFRL